MVELVADGAGEEPFRRKLVLAAEPVAIYNFHLFGAGNYALLALYRKAALGARLLALFIVYFGIDELEKALLHVYHDYARRTGVSDAALWLLYVIRLGGNNLTQASICADWHYPPQTINSALKRLESQGLVALAPATGSRRDKAVSLTTEGERVAAGAIDPLIEAERSALAALGPEERAALVSLSRRYLDLLSERLDALEGGAR